MKAFIERGNTIDLLLTLKLSSIVTDLTHFIGFLFSDHYVIMFSVSHRKPPRPVISRQLSKLHYISISNFSIYLSQLPAVTSVSPSAHVPLILKRIVSRTYSS